MTSSPHSRTPSFFLGNSQTTDSNVVPGCTVLSCPRNVYTSRYQSMYGCVSAPIGTCLLKNIRTRHSVVTRGRGNRAGDSLGTSRDLKSLISCSTPFIRKKDGTTDPGESRTLDVTEESVRRLFLSDFSTRSLTYLGPSPATCSLLRSPR